MTATFEEQFGIETCYENVKFDVEKLNKNIFQLLGKYIARAEQDKFFNKTMIDAAKLYIQRNNISWKEA